MRLIAIAMFVILFVFGPQILGYADDDGTIKIALFATFVLGLVAGYSGRN